MKIMLFRFDDICLNTDMDHANELAEMIRGNLFGVRIMYCISPICFELNNERVYPKIYNAMSDYKIFFDGDRLGIPDNIPEYAELLFIVFESPATIAAEALEVAFIVLSTPPKAAE